MPLSQAMPPGPARYDQDFDNTISIIDLSLQAAVFLRSVTSSACV